MSERGLRVIVCGGRDFNDGEFVWSTLSDFYAERPISVVIHGAASGADEQAMIWAQMMAKAHGVKHAPFAADWGRHGKAAGPMRNQRMIDEGRPDFVIAFPGGRGTADMVRRARAAGLPVFEPKRSPSHGA